jgi:hypothetical protein
MGSYTRGVNGTVAGAASSVAVKSPKTGQSWPPGGFEVIGVGLYR